MRYTKVNAWLSPRAAQLLLAGMQAEPDVVISDSERADEGMRRLRVPTRGPRTGPGGATVTIA